MVDLELGIKLCVDFNGKDWMNGLIEAKYRIILYYLLLSLKAPCKINTEIALINSTKSEIIFDLNTLTFIS